MLPSSPWRICSSVGVGLRSQQLVRRQDHPRRAEPALQAVLVPERLLQRMRACRRRARPSIVVTDAPSACTARQVHDLTATPSSSTVQAPHWLVSQPILVPVSAGELAKEMHEQQARLDIALVGAAVDRQPDRNCHDVPPKVVGRPFQGRREKPRRRLAIIVPNRITSGASGTPARCVDAR